MNAPQLQASDLTYFALASTAATPATVEPKAIAGELPEVLCGRYRIERLLGVGGMGAVYRARDLLREQFGDPEPYVALKTLSEDFAEYPDASALLYSEYALTTRLSHRHVVRLYNFDIDPASQRAFITLELLKGPTLDQLLCERPQGMAWSELQGIALPLLEALTYSHSLGVLHGDLKPSNVMLADDGLRLFDYGLGQPLEGLLPGLPRLCRTRFAAWTPRYAALELLDGGDLTASADIYALACGPALRLALAFDEAQRSIDAAGLLHAFSRPAPSRWQRWFGHSHG
jgi:serine/threonine-protein kinase Stk1